MYQPPTWKKKKKRTESANLWLPFSCYKSTTSSVLEQRLNAWLLINAGRTSAFPEQILCIQLSLLKYIPALNDHKITHHETGFRGV